MKHSLFMSSSDPPQQVKLMHEPRLALSSDVQTERPGSGRVSVARCFSWNVLVSVIVLFPVISEALCLRMVTH